LNSNKAATGFSKEKWNISENENWFGGQNSSETMNQRADAAGVTQAYTAREDGAMRETMTCPSRHCLGNICFASDSV
jgi:hypothetical protein